MPSLKILLLENVAAQAAAVRNALTQAGHQVAVSRFPAEGLGKLGDWKADLVILSSSHTQDNLSYFCRELRRKAGPSLRIIIASSLPTQSIFEESPELRKLVDGFVPRPYDPASLLSSIEKIASGPGEITVPAGESPSDGTAGDEVLFIGRDRALAEALREHLRPEGVRVTAAPWEDAVTFGRSRRPKALVMEWPVPESFSVAALREIQESVDGTRLPLILLSASGREVVKARSPALLNRTDMLFTKPVPWPHFLRFLLRALDLPSPGTEERRSPPGASVAPAAAGEGHLRESFQRQMEEKFLEAEELRRRIRQLEVRHSRDEGAETQKLLQESRVLIQRLEKEKKDAEVELAKQKFREADLEMRLSRLLRQQSESERKVQDLLDAGREREEEMQRSLAEAHGELQMREEQAASLKYDLEQARLETGRAAEGGRQAEVDLAKQKFRESDLELQIRNLLLRKNEAERRFQGLIEEAREGEEVLQRSLSDAHIELHARDKELGTLRRQFEEAAQGQRETGEELQSVRLVLEKKLQELGELQDRLRTEREESRTGAEALRRLVSEAEGRKEDALRRLSVLEGETAGLRERLAASESKAAALEQDAAGLREERKEWEAMAAAMEGTTGQIQAALEEKETLLSRLESAVADKDHALGDLRERLRASEMAVAGLDEELSGWRERLSEAEAALAAREEDNAERKDVAERLRAFEESAEQKAGIIAKLERELEASDRERGNLAVLLEERRGEAELADQKLLEKTREVERLRDQVADVERELEKKEAELSRQNGLLAEAADRIRSLEGQEAAPARVRELEERVAERERSVAELGGRLEEATAEAGRLRNLLAETESDAARAGRRTAESLRSLKEENETLRAGVDEAADGRRRAESEAADLRRRLERAEKDFEKQGSSREAMETRMDEALEGRRRAVSEAADLRERVQRLAAQLQGEKASREDLERLQEKEILQEREKRQSLKAVHEEMSRRLMEAESAAREQEKVKKLLEEVMSRAQSEVMERTRREVELEERLRTSLEEKKFILSRLERELSEASGRERRLSELLEKSLQGSAELAASFAEGGRARRRDNLPVAIPEKPGRDTSRPSSFAAAALVLLALAAGLWFAKGRDGFLRPPAGESPVAGAVDSLTPERTAWEEWTRSDVSGGVLLQATLRTREELALEVEAERKARGMSDKEAQEELLRLLQPYRFSEYFYFYLYLKNLHPGYPAYADDIHSRLVLRDDEGNETPAFVPADLEKHRRLYSFASGDLAQNRQELIYEVNVPVAFDRSALSPSPAYLELLAFNIGSSSRRVLTWELQ